MLGLDLAPRDAVRRPILLALGAGIGALLVRERRGVRQSERLAAAALETLLNAIDANDASTGAHVRRVAAYSMTLARVAGLDDAMIRSIERVALFHDIGKIHEALFDIVHDQDDTVTPDERRLITTHPKRGADVLKPLSFFYPDLPAGVLAHHERWDGSGYPHGLSGVQIPIQARVVAIADTFDAITHRRRYRRAQSVEDAARVIADGSGTQFDPSLAAIIRRPHVLEQFQRIARRTWQPSASTSGGRRHHGGSKAPDVTFRWRGGPQTSPP